MCYGSGNFRPGYKKIRVQADVSLCDKAEFRVDLVINNLQKLMVCNSPCFTFCLLLCHSNTHTVSERDKTETMFPRFWTNSTTLSKSSHVGVFLVEVTGYMNSPLHPEAATPNPSSPEPQPQVPNHLPKPQPMPEPQQPPPLPAALHGLLLKSIRPSFCIYVVHWLCHCSTLRMHGKLLLYAPTRLR